MEFYSQQTLPGKFPNPESDTCFSGFLAKISDTRAFFFYWWKDSMGLKNLPTSFLLDLLEKLVDGDDDVL